MSSFEIRLTNPRRGSDDPYDLVRRYSAESHSQAWGMTDEDIVALYQVLHRHIVARLGGEPQA